MTPVGIRPNTAAFRASVSEGEGLYQGMIVGVRRRLTNGLDFTASYTLGKAESIIGTANDELDANYIQDATNPTADVNYGPTARTDARHRVSLSAVIQAPWGIQVSPFFIFRSALPIQTFEGSRPEQRRQHQRHHRHGLPVTGVERRRHRHVRRERRLRDGELQPRLGVLAAEPAREQGLRARAAAPGSRRSREMFNVFNAQEPGLQPHLPAGGYDHRGAARDLHAAGRTSPATSASRSSASVRSGSGSRF